MRGQPGQKHEVSKKDKRMSKKDKKVSSCRDISFDVNLDRCRSPGDEVSKLSLSNSLKAFVHLTFRLVSKLISRTVCVHFNILRVFLADNKTWVGSTSPWIMLRMEM